MTDDDVTQRQAAAYGQLQGRFLGLQNALADQIRAFDAAVGQILAILGAQAEALAKLAQSADLAGTPIEELMLGAREYGVLARAGIHKVEQLTEMSEDDLEGLRNAGSKSVANIKARIEEFGLALKAAADD